MTEYLELPSTPLDEKCINVGECNYYALSRIEIRVMQDYLLRLFGQPPEGAYYGTKRMNHDFGSYPELRIYFVEENEAASKFAYDLDSNVPAEWDSVALKKLEEAGYPMHLTKKHEKEIQS